MRSLILEIDPSAVPVIGALYTEDGRRHDFAGWLDLASALDLIIDDPPRPSAERMTTDGRSAVLAPEPPDATEEHR